MQLEAELMDDFGNTTGLGSEWVNEKPSEIRDVISEKSPKPGWSLASSDKRR
jgi:hypothetical protein